jgi:hypothetical protein
MIQLRDLNENCEHQAPPAAACIWDVSAIAAGAVQEKRTVPVKSPNRFLTPFRLTPFRLPDPVSTSSPHEHFNLATAANVLGDGAFDGTCPLVREIRSWRQAVLKKIEETS